MSINGQHKVKKNDFVSFHTVITISSVQCSLSVTILCAICMSVYSMIILFTQLLDLNAVRKSSR